MSELKPAYLIHGDDHGAVAERRAGLRALAETLPDGAASVEVLEGDAATPAGVARALAALTLGFGRRVMIVEGVERWRGADVEKELVPALQAIPPGTTLALFAREEGRTAAPAGLADAVKRAGGQVVAQMAVKPWELAKWVSAQATRLGLALDRGAAQALIKVVGERQQRLLRELEKLSLEAGAREDAAAGSDDSREPVPVTAEQVEERAAHSAQWRAYALADALVAGNERMATASLLGLREQGERLSGLTYLMASRLRDALAISLRLHEGESPAQIKRSLRMPSRAAERLIADVATSDPERLRRALCGLADLELDSRGGAPIAASRSALSALPEDTIALRTIETVTDQPPPR
jgi:DNA polymerase III subunit delta